MTICCCTKCRQSFATDQDFRWHYDEDDLWYDLDDGCSLDDLLHYQCGKIADGDLWYDPDYDPTPDDPPLYWIEDHGVLSAHPLTIAQARAIDRERREPLDT